MNYFTHEKVTSTITRIRDVTGVCMYLVEGRQRAALIDTGVGLGDLSGYVRTLTDKDLLVLITHGHVDHAMGAGAFSEAYIHPADESIYRAHSTRESRIDYVANCGVAGGHPEALEEASESDWIPVKAWEEFRHIAVGDIFDLGGVHLEICGGAGHTRGCVTILHNEEQILFLGDAANDFTFLFDMNGGDNCLPLSEYEANLQALESCAGGRYKRCMFFHGSGEGSANMVAGVIALIAEIMSGKDDGLSFSAMGVQGLRLAKAIDFSRMCRMDGGIGNLIYDPALKN